MFKNKKISDYIKKNKSQMNSAVKWILAILDRNRVIPQFKTLDGKWKPIKSVPANCDNKFWQEIENFRNDYKNKVGTYPKIRMVVKRTERVLFYY
jgi:hypothetical protein